MDCINSENQSLAKGCIDSHVILVLWLFQSKLSLDHVQQYSCQLSVVSAFAAQMGVCTTSRGQLALLKKALLGIGLDL